MSLIHVVLDVGRISPFSKNFGVSTTCLIFISGHHAVGILSSSFGYLSRLDFTPNTCLSSIGPILKIGAGFNFDNEIESSMNKDILLEIMGGIFSTYSYLQVSQFYVNYHNFRCPKT